MPRRTENVTEGAAATNFLLLFSGVSLKVATCGSRCWAGHNPDWSAA
jgi:hypothetical protein